MANDNNMVNLTTSGSSILKERGIYYFKLNPEYFLYREPGEDEQKSCGLLGSEIDSNFHFLSGMDIKQAAFDPENKILVLERVNPDLPPIEIDLTTEGPLFGDPSLYFDTLTGELVVVFPNGTSASTSGFLVDNSFKTSTNGTLIGLGNKLSPLSLSPVEKTGQYSPVLRLEDFTLESGRVLSELSGACGERVVTKENVNDFGALYPFTAVEKIEKYLEDTGSPWRVPSEQDWNELLNAMEDDEEAKTHGNRGYRRGFVAGEKLKSPEIWRVPGSGMFGFNVLPSGYFSVGRGLTDFGEGAGFWTYTEDDAEDVVVKKFVSNFDGVIHDDYTKDEGGQWFSIRLVRDYEPGCVNPYEDILGQSIRTGVISCGDYSKVWTLSNLYLTSPEEGVTGFEVPSSGELPTVAYFINEFGNDGKPIRKRMVEGDTVVILDEDYHEFMLKDGELVDMTQLVADEAGAMVDSASTQLTEKIDELSASTMAFSADVETLLAEMSAQTESAITAASDAIMSSMTEFSGSIIDTVNELSAGTESAITAETERAEDAEQALSDRIDDLSGTVETFSGNVVDAISEVNTRISNEISAITDEIYAVKTDVSNLRNDVEVLSGSVIDEINEVKDSIVSAITDEKAERLAADEEINNTISGFSGSVIDAVEDIKDSIVSAISSEISARTEADTEIKESVSELSASVESIKEEIDSTIETITNNMSAISSDIRTEISDVSASVMTTITEKISELSAITNNIISDASEAAADVAAMETELLNTIAETSANTLDAAKDYTDEKIGEVNETKVVDIKYDQERNLIYLLKADGTPSSLGIPASEFVKDGMLKSVTFDSGNTQLIFKWNTESGIEDTTVPLTSLSNVYTIGSGSVTYLKMNGSEFSAIVDKADGFEKTLATTKFAEDRANEAVSAAVEAIKTDITPLEQAIETLNGDKTVPGSVAHSMDDKFAKDVLTAGTPATSVSLEEARQHSLMRVINVDGDNKYYVSSDARDMQYFDGTSNVNLNNYITALENRIAELEDEKDALEDRVAELEDKIIDEEGVKDIIASYLNGTAKEIKIARDGDNLTIGFADDAIFGPIRS